jgi:hypothetical protein
MGRLSRRTLPALSTRHLRPVWSGFSPILQGGADLFKALQGASWLDNASLDQREDPEKAAEG